jgi:ribosome-associated protein
MSRLAGPHRGQDHHYGDADEAGDDAGPARPSKTQRKQQSHDLQTLGEQLAALSAERLAGVPMPDALREALAEWRRTRTHEGRRRQMQYVGKLMRGADADALREAVAEATLGSARETLALHEAERWRAELIADDQAFERWLSEHPQTDAQRLRSLVRAARRDATGLAPEARQPKSFRELYQFIRPLLAAAGAPAAGAEGADRDDAG